ncbi:MAG: ATP-binding protein [Kiritimatiellae bacterium]|nr:ATP-binding protein [Kiritimatiellia bacterium]
MDNPLDSRERIRVLAVDDDQAILDFYAKVLREPVGITRQRGGPVFAITLCGNVKDALDRVRQGVEKGEPFAVVFLDVRIPRGIDGVRAAERIRTLDPAVNIVLVTGFDDVEPERVAQRIPPPDRLLYMRKPFAPAELRQLALALAAKYSLEKRGVEKTGGTKGMKAADSGGADNELVRKEAFNFALFQYNPLPITVVDRQGSVIRSNLARRASNLPLPEIGQPLFAGWCKHCGVDLQQALQECIRLGNVKEYPELKVGPAQWVSITIAPFPDGAIVILNDITRVKQAEEEARLHEERLVRAQKMAALGSLVAGVAHEVSNPNNVLLLNASILRRMCDELRAFLTERREQQGEFEIAGMTSTQACAELPRLVEGMARAAERIRDTVEGLKQFARKGDTVLVEGVDVNAVVAAAVALLDPLLRKSTKKLEVDYGRELPHIRGNKQQLEQVVVNLLTNACQALQSPEKGIRITTRFLEQLRRVEIEVHDEGCGIPPDILPRVTEPFFTTREDSGGTGLGLAISEKIVTDHGGTLRFSSRPNEGTTVTVAIPVRCRENQESG